MPHKHTHIIDAAPASALQILPERDGFIPVYVRYGNTPLKEINLNLAAAFHEDDLPPLNAPEELNEQNETDMLDISDLKKYEDESPKVKRDTSDKVEDKKLEQKQTSAQTSEECSGEEKGKTEDKRRRRSANSNESSGSSEEDKQKKDETKKSQPVNSSEESSSESEEEKKNKQAKTHASDEKKEIIKTIRRRSADTSEGGETNTSVDNSADSHSNEDESNPSTLHVIKQLPAAPARK